MTARTLSQAAVQNIPSESVLRLSVLQYHRMIAAGILTDDNPVELLEGWLITRMPKNPPHTLTTQLTGELLARMLPLGWFVNVQEPITLADSEPEPDITVVRGERRDFIERHPGAAEIALIVEVADSTLQRDRVLKLRIYAQAAIPVYWIINLAQRQIEVYSAPIQEGVAAYTQSQVYAATDRIPLLLDGQPILDIAVRDLLA